MTTSFYDALAPYYHLLYPDWEASVERQAESITSVLTGLGIRPGARVLDAACGIGTQVVGLAARGYAVRASDAAPAAVSRARVELASRGLPGEVVVADLRCLAEAHPGAFDAVVALDNAVPHLLTDAEILTAFRSCRDRLAPGGYLLVSVRDYATIERSSPDVHPYGLRRVGERRFLAVQVWEWDGDCYDLRLYLTEEAGDGTCRTTVLRSRYYAVTTNRLLELMVEAGFTHTERRDGAFFQPLLIGQRP